MIKEKEDHARENAKAHLESLMESYDPYTTEEDQGAKEEIEERLRDGVLEVCVRSGWYYPGSVKDSNGNAEEFKILLTTGGPALRIVGELNEHLSPLNNRMEYQDWGTPWTEYRLTNEEQEAVDWYCSLFYFGE
jgi:hypothetical protein